MPRKKVNKLRSTCDCTIRNDFHNTSYTFRTRYYKALSRDQIRLCRNALCGVSNCTCGGVLSERGEQDFVIRDGFDVTGARIVTLEPIRKRV
jgi:hypothetical protein